MALVLADRFMQKCGGDSIPERRPYFVFRYVNATHAKGAG